MTKNPFFKNKGPISLKIIFNSCDLDSNKADSKTKIFDVKSLDLCTNNDISFFHSIKYKDQANNTKAKICITTDKLKKYLPDLCKKNYCKKCFIKCSKNNKIILSIICY